MIATFVLFYTSSCPPSCALSTVEVQLLGGGSLEAPKTIIAINAGGPTIQTSDGTVFEQDR